jgi:hypothetical protein
LNSNSLLTLALLLLCLTSSGAAAHSKTDSITLYNGDRITGEIKHLYGGLLQYGTDSMGTIKVEWQEISRVESRFHYEVRTSAGERLFGTIGPGERPGQLRIAHDEGTRDLEWLQVVELRPVEDKLIDRLDVYLSAGYSYTKASDVGEITFNAQVSYEDERTRTALDGRTMLTQTNEQTTHSNRYDISRWRWRDRAQVFRSVGATYEDNDELNLDHRISVGAGLGRYFIDTHRSRLLGLAGLQVITEKTTQDGESQDVELFGTGDYALWQFNTPELNLNLKFNLYPSLTDVGRVRTDTNLILKWEIVEDLFWDINAWATTDNQAESNREVDYGISTGVGWEL